MLESSSPVLASVAMKGGGLIQDVKGLSNAELITVSAGNKDGLVEVLVERLAKVNL